MKHSSVESMQPPTPKEEVVVAKNPFETDFDSGGGGGGGGYFGPPPGSYGMNDPHAYGMMRPGPMGMGSMMPHGAMPAGPPHPGMMGGPQMSPMGTPMMAAGHMGGGPMSMAHMQHPGAMPPHMQPHMHHPGFGPNSGMGGPGAAAAGMHPHMNHAVMHAGPPPHMHMPHTSHMPASMGLQSQPMPHPSFSQSSISSSVPSMPPANQNCSSSSSVYSPAPNKSITHCVHCNQKFTQSDERLDCLSGCSTSFHRSCAGLSKTAFDLLMKEAPLAEWACDHCVNTKQVPLVRDRPMPPHANTLKPAATALRA